ncbi:MAG: YihY/virulence factor BrkB family protein [Bacilli bacterium]|nr:YihY/virulence factor BrkB family protein [Bacilli bacterium]
MKNKFEIFLSKILLILKKPQMRVLPGNIAFYFVLSIIPLITLFVFFGSLINIPSSDLLNFFNQTFPESISKILIPAFTESTINFSTVVLIIITLFIASNGANSIIITSNTLYKIRKSDPLKNRIKAFVITFIFLDILLFMFIIPIFGAQIIEVISNLFHNQNVYKALMIIYNVLQIPLSLLFIYFNIKVVYTISPDEKIKSKDVTNGALFTTITWVIAAQIYSYYVEHFSNYTRVYGNLSNLIMLMLFIYLLAYIFVIGMALNASSSELEEEIERTGKINLLKVVHNNKGYTK